MKKLFAITAMLLCGVAVLGAQGLPEGVIMPDKPTYKNYVEYSELEKGFWVGVDLSAGPSFDFDTSRKTGLTTDLHVVLGYRFNSYIMIGAGAGAKVYALPGNRVDASHPGQIVSVPVFLNARGVLMNPRSRGALPCWSMDVGYTVFDGVYLSPMFGVRVGTHERNHFIAGIAYVMQGADLSVNGTNTRGFLHSAQLKLGYQF